MTSVSQNLAKPNVVRSACFTALIKIMEQSIKISKNYLSIVDEISTISKRILKDIDSLSKLGVDVELKINSDKFKESILNILHTNQM